MKDSTPILLEKYATILVQWAESLPFKKVYFLGSRVRGDAREGSDMDIACICEAAPSIAATAKWDSDSLSGFKELEKALGVRLHIIMENVDPEVWAEINKVAHSPIFSIGKVVCVITPPKKVIENPLQNY